MDKIKTIFNKVKQFVSNNDVEITAFISAFFIIYASFLVNKILGVYVIGLIFAGLSMFLLKNPEK